MGDPQAPFSTVLQVLREHGLLTSDDRLRDDVHLVSMGDHFDWGRRQERARATDDGLRLLEWLASHPASQVTLLLGNHDVARVQELAPFDATSFAEAQRLADAAYVDGKTDAVREEELLRAYPWLPNAECVARDFSCFSVSQRGLVTSLLRSGRFRLALAHGGLLLNHAGVTVEELDALPPTERSPVSIADALNTFLSSRVAAWSSGPLELGPLHRPGSAAEGEGVGLLYHRPTEPSQLRAPLGPSPRRRYDPRRLPTGITQVIGHIRDDKCRSLMPSWSSAESTPVGALRSLTIDGDQVRYGPGIAPSARLIFTDGSMGHVAPQMYQLLDLATVQPRSKRASTGV